ncbi:diguanylate cyclase [Leptolyngbya sp. 'hensonii']|uniref:sensor domain-containing diguanylate cyclase n=1 Tax=Leptolyngbya sp. 'hensonii' TaxID=1922337 RepID=UPI0015C52B69|nr:diguanylate cyclase [Leptolyngbya sp. 'hensonii']
MTSRNGIWFGLAIVLFLSISSQINVRQARLWVSHTFEVLDEIEETQFNLLSSKFQFQKWLNTQNGQTLIEYQKCVGIVQRSIERLLQLTQDNPSQHRKVTDFQSSFKQQLQQEQRVIQELQVSPRKIISPDRAILYSESLWNQLLAIQQVEKTLLQQRREETDQKGEIATGVILISLVCVLLLSWRIGFNQLRQKQAEADLTQKLQATELEQDLSNHLLTCRTAKEAYDILQSFLTYLLPNCAGMIYEINNSRDQMTPTVTFGNLKSGSICSPRECWALRRGEAQSGGQTVFRLPCQLCRELHPHGIPTEMLCLPLQAHEQTLGVLHLTEVPLAQHALMTTLASQIALPLAVLRLQSQLEYLSFHDANTGIYNRRFLDEMMTRAIAAAQRKNHQLGDSGPVHTVGVIFMDVDHFKRFNSEHGHEAGDKVLRILGNFLTEITRGGEDVACRYGGEEFVLIMSGADEAATFEKAEIIRAGIARYPAPGGATITLSLGIATYPTNGTTAEEVLRAANIALLRAKAEGRNRTVIAT